MENEDVFEMYRLCPILIPSSDFKSWQGFITLRRNFRSDYFLSLKTPHFPLAKDIGYRLSYSLEKLVIQHINSVSKCQTVIEFVRNLIHILHTKLDLESTVREENINWNSVKLFNTIVQNMDKESFDRNNVEDIDPVTGHVKLNFVDSSRNSYYMVVSVGNRYPESLLQVLEADLPDEVLSDLPKVSSFKLLFDAFKSSVLALVPFWGLMDELHEKTWIIEPDIIHKKHVHRRILINDNLSIVLTFNPLKIHQCPDIEFLGALQTVTMARKTYQNNLQEIGWNNGVSLLENISLLCEIDNFPRKPDVSVTSDSNECYICFSNSLPPPTKWCSNNRCSSFYHIRCLLEWLTTVPTSITMFGFIKGPCPYCNEYILCPFKPSDLN